MPNLTVHEYARTHWGPARLFGVPHGGIAKPGVRSDGGKASVARYSSDTGEVKTAIFELFRPSRSSGAQLYKNPWNGAPGAPARL